jgi:ferredoxin
MSDEVSEAAAAADGADGEGGEAGERVVGPSPALEPEAVVQVLADALGDDGAGDAADQRRDTDGGDDEMSPAVRTLFDFAAPGFRTTHGSLAGFARTFTGPLYDRLVEATAVERGPAEREDGTFTQVVLARHPAGDRTYEFRLAEQSAGKYAGCWMTTDVELVYDGASPRFRRTPSVSFDGRTVSCEVGDRLRDVLLAADGRSPHNDAAQVANCGGNGLCGTCAVDVDGDVSEPGEREERRLSLPPHDGDAGLRLACQTRVEGDVSVTKHDGLWGQHVGEHQDETEDADSKGDDADDAAGDAVLSVTAAEYAGDYAYAAVEGGGER